MSKKTGATMYVTRRGVFIRPKRKGQRRPARGRASGTWYPDRKRKDFLSRESLQEFTAE